MQRKNCRSQRKTIANQTERKTSDEKALAIKSVSHSCQTFVLSLCVSLLINKLLALILNGPICIFFLPIGKDYHVFVVEKFYCTKLGEERYVFVSAL